MLHAPRKEKLNERKKHQQKIIFKMGSGRKVTKMQLPAIIQAVPYGSNVPLLSKVRSDCQPFISWPGVC
jgi:hypothetical protein